MVPYKRIDLIVEAFSSMPEKKLVVIGDGPELRKVRARAGQNVQVLGYQPFEVLRDYMRRARAFVFAAEEDFGLAPLEAQACGTPVIAFGKGGAAETVLHGQTGILFASQTVAALKAAVAEFETGGYRFDVATLRENAERFSAERFRRRFMEYLTRVWDDPRLHFPS